MLLVPLILLSGAGPKIQVWRSHVEVYALARSGKSLYAATSGGVLQQDGDSLWQPVGTNAPTGLRSLLTDGLLRGVTADGKVFAFKNNVWVAYGKADPPAKLDIVPPAGSGAVASAKTGDLVSFWGAKNLYRQTGGSWRSEMPRSPTDGDYALLLDGDTLMAGTNQGLWAYYRNRWQRQVLPGELPVARVQGLAQADGKWLVGGLTGLFMGTPGHWESISTDPVRQIASYGGAVWALYGSGAVEKLEPGKDRRYPDLLHGAVKRPWTSVLSVSEDRFLAGGLGGWVEKTEDGWEEHYPWMLKDQVVTAIAADGSNQWVGTQTGGLYRFEKLHVLHWTPAQGLGDLWVTSLAKTPSGMAVGTSGAGVFVIGKNDKVRPIRTPSKRIRHLTSVNGHLVVGALEGAWVSSGSKWEVLPTNGEETTDLLSTGPSLTVLTSAGVYFVPRK